MADSIYIDGLKMIVDTVREPFVVLSDDMRVLFANRAFYRAFNVSPEDTESKLIFHLGNGQWNIPELRHLLEQIIPGNESIKDYRVKRRFPKIGEKIFMLNATRLVHEKGPVDLILLAMEDVTIREHANERLNLSILESNHRIKNSLNVIVSHIEVLFRQKGLLVKDDLDDLVSNIKAYASLHDILSIQASQCVPDQTSVAMKPLLERLLSTLRDSIGERKIQWRICDFSLVPFKASSFGLALNELVINSLKFTNGSVSVLIQKVDDWISMEITDDGVGYPGDFKFDVSKPTGISLISKLIAMDLHGQLEFENLSEGGCRAMVTIPYDVNLGEGLAEKESHDGELHDGHDFPYLKA